MSVRRKPTRQESDILTQAAASHERNDECYVRNTNAVFQFAPESADVLRRSSRIQPKEHEQGERVVGLRD